MEIEIQSRLNIGPVIGWGWYQDDEIFDYSEVVIYLLIISLHIRWQ